MKKLFILATLVVVFFSSCKKYEASEPLDLSNLPTVTLTGVVYADLDETTTELEYVPQGLLVKVSIPYTNYDSEATNSGNYIITTTIQQDGKYSIAVPVISKGVTATLSFEDFTFDVKVINNSGVEETVQKHFACNNQTVTGLGSAKGESDHICINTQYRVNQVNPNNTTHLVD